jgi:catechol 2,3-dioxygenase-like lactoylglutathione lyase family enzyme
MDWKLELVAVPVSDVDRAKAFYAEKVGFDVDLDVSADTDHRVSDERGVVQLTPPGSACSIAFGIGILDTQPGSVQALHLVVSDIQAARAGIVAAGWRSAR